MTHSEDQQHAGQRLHGRRSASPPGSGEHRPAAGTSAATGVFGIAGASPAAAARPDERPDPQGDQKTVAGKKGVKDARHWRGGGLAGRTAFLRRVELEVQAG